MPASRPLLMTTASAVLFGVMALAAKLAALHLPAGEIAFMRFAVMMVPLVAVPRLARRALEFERADLLVYRGIFGGTAVLLYFLAIAHIPVGIATLLNYTSPVYSILFAALFLGERVDRRLLLPLAAALVGMVLAAGGGHRSGPLLQFGPWEIVGMCSAVLSGAAFASIRAARRTESSWSIYGSFSICGLLATAPFVIRGFERPTPREWFFLVSVGVCSLLAQLLMTWAFRWVTNLEAGVISQLTVVVSILLGALVLGDRLTPVQSVGSVLTLTGVVGVVWLQAGGARLSG